ncbi:MAG: TetR/AcrR family transcriptional regulator [Myxococcota bacterium]
MARPRLVSDREILDAARACFVEQGPQVSTAVIAEQVGLSQAALFKRFGTKQQLLMAALAPPEIPEWIALVERGPDERPIPEQLTEIAQAISEFFVEMTPRLATMWASGCDMRAIMAQFKVPPPIRGLQALTQWFEAARDAGRIGDCNPRALALMYIGSLNGRAWMGTILGSETVNVDLDQYASQLAQTMWRGLAPEEGE